MGNPFKTKSPITLEQKIKYAEAILRKVPKLRDEAIRDLHWVEDEYEPYYHSELKKARRKRHKAISLIKSCKKHIIWVNDYEKQLTDKLKALRERQRQKLVLTGK